MARDKTPKEPKQRGLLGRLLVPRRPHITTDTGLGVREEARLLSRSMQMANRLCPNDGTAMQLEDVFDMDVEGNAIGDPYRAFVCPTCDASIPIQNIMHEVSGQLAAIKKNERDYLLYGLGIIVIFGIISMRTGNLLTAIGGFIFGLALMTLSIFLRYRRWQIVNSRLFEVSPPIRDFFRDEFSK